MDKAQAAQVDSIFSKVFDAMQDAEEMGGPEGEAYQALMRRISQEAMKRANTHWVNEMAEQQGELTALLPADSVPVKHWERYEDHSAPVLHQIDVQDMRATNGQLYVTAGSIEGGTEEMISAVAEINTNPENGVDHVPCLHVSFDADALAFSAFKVADRILLRLEEGVSLTLIETPAGQMYAVN